MIIILFLASTLICCQGTHTAGGTQTSTAPMSNDPTETMPSRAADEDNNKIRPRTGTAPTNEQLPDETGSTTQGDSTTKR